MKRLKYYLSFANPLIPWKTRICRKYGPGVEASYDFFAQSQWWSREQLEAYQAKKLRKLICHLYQNLPYYRHLMDSRHLTPNDIRSVKDLNKLPILTKTDIRANFKDLLSNDFVKERTSLGRTGASTGEPLTFYRDAQSTDAAWGAFFGFAGWTGFVWGDRMAYFWRTPDSQKNTGTWYQNLIDRLLFEYVSKMRYFDAFKMSEEYFQGYAADLRKWQPELIKAYPSALLYFADYCAKQRISDIRPKAIITTAEPISMSERKALKDVFSCDVFDQYGFGEIFGVSFECEKHEGLHINQTHCVMEIVDEAGETIEGTKEGRIIVTDLDNFMMPFVRYDCGDIGSLKDKPCSCGRGLPMMNHVRGRVFGLIRGVNGNVVHGEFFSDILQDLGWYEAYGLLQFEVVQRTAEGFKCSFVCSTRPRQSAIDEFIEVCKAQFGEMRIDVNFVASIPLTTAGKRRNTRSEIDPLRSNTG
ncbi:phenylacetate--CoA ligase family protein [Elusimicrobiota bacterium]